MTLIGIYIEYLIYAMNVAILGRVIMSWISPGGRDPISNILIQITEPLLGPIRRVLPTMGMFDFTPLVALILLNFLILPIVRSVT